MEAHIEHIGADLLCRAKSAPAELRIPGDQALGQLKEWAKRYAAAVRHDGEAELLAIGREMFAWLDSNGWASAWAKSTGPRALEIQVDDLDEALAQAMLDAPWELLAHRNEYLADDGIQIFEVVRRIGPRAEAIVPRYSDMQLMFMAAAPQEESSLDFEAEEAAILEVTARLPLHLVVEESGVAEFLGEHLHLDGPFEALHLSCHGDIDPKRGHILALEDEIGERADADANDIVRLLGDPEQTPLVFLSACRTAEQTANDGEGARRFEPFVRDLIRAGVANVLGWDGSVYDTDAAAFARTFYRELAGRERIPRAVAAARLALRRTQQEDPQRGSHWHLARLYLGPRGGGALAVRGLAKRKLAGAAWEEQFLDKVRGEVPVARRSEFVGRRRQAQQVLKAFRDGSAGVLIQGMGNLGKSSLAARIASRMTGHTTVVVFGVYDVLTVFDRIVEAVPAQQRAEVRASWREAVLADATALSDTLEALLEGPLDQQPVLLIIDDLEQILEIPEQSDAPTPVQQRYRATIKAVLCAFARAQTDSRLLITCRYRFSLPDGRGGDLAENLTCIPLQPMDSVDQSKQLRAAARTENIVEPAMLEEELVLRALAVAGGNSGLQAVLMTPILKGETETARKALETIESFQQTGVSPEVSGKLIKESVARDESNGMLAFFQRMAFDTCKAALTPAQGQMLRAACLFAPGLPIPSSALQAAGAAVGGADPATALTRLLGLGLFDDWGVVKETRHAAANPLARPLAAALDDATKSRLADAVLPALDAAWRDTAGNFSQYSRAMEITRLALVASHPDPALLDNAAEAAARYLFKREQNARRAQDTVLQPALERLNALGSAPGHGLLLIACECAGLLGEREAQERVLEMMRGSDAVGSDQGDVLLYQGRAWVRLGELGEAERAFTEAVAVFQEAGEERSWAIARGQIADILQFRGDLEEALRIRTEDELPVYERLGDVREKAVTQGKIADILQSRGDLEEALRLLKEEVFGAFERLGDVRLKAMTQGQIAGILQSRGDLEEALRLLKEEVLGVFERLGDVRSKAVTQGKIADILQFRGDLDEALRIRTEEQLPVYERLGDVRSKAVTQGKIADILQFRGDLEEALRIHTEDELPVYERLGDVRQKAMTQGKIADILQSRGDLEEALRLFKEEVLGVFERLGDSRSKAMTQGKIADILQSRGDLEEALRIRTEDELPVYERLGDVRSKAVTQGKIADILQSRGDLDEALRICTEDELPVYERLGDVRSKAMTQGKIAGILQSRGDLEEALRLLKEEVLGAFERLGDVRSKAVTQGKIAGILQSCGKLNEALAMHGQRLPIAKRLGDIDSIAHIKFSIASLRLQRGDHKTGGLQQIHDDLSEAFGISLKLGRPDFIRGIGQLFAQVLAMGGQKDAAVKVLQLAQEAFEKLGHDQGVKQVRELRERIDGDMGTGE